MAGPEGRRGVFPKGRTSTVPCGRGCVGLSRQQDHSQAAQADREHSLGTGTPSLQVFKKARHASAQTTSKRAMLPWASERD